jgi:hypothetical protein
MDRDGEPGLSCGSPAKWHHGRFKGETIDKNGPDALLKKLFGTEARFAKRVVQTCNMNGYVELDLQMRECCARNL